MSSQENKYPSALNGQKKTKWNKKKSSKNWTSLKSPLQRVANLKISPSARQIQPVEPKSQSAESPDHVSLLSQGRKGADLPEGSENFLAKSRLSIFFLIFLYSQAPDLSELSHQNIFQLSRLSMNCFVKTVKHMGFYKPFGFYEKPVSTTVSL